MRKSFLVFIAAQLLAALFAHDLTLSMFLTMTLTCVVALRRSMSQEAELDVLSCAQAHLYCQLLVLQCSNPIGHVFGVQLIACAHVCVLSFIHKHSSFLIRFRTILQSLLGPAILAFLLHTCVAGVPWLWSCASLCGMFGQALLVCTLGQEKFQNTSEPFAAIGRDHLLVHISHELRTPLTAIQASLNIIQSHLQRANDLLLPQHPSSESSTSTAPSILEQAFANASPPPTVPYICPVHPAAQGQLREAMDQVQILDCCSKVVHSLVDEILDYCHIMQDAECSSPIGSLRGFDEDDHGNSHDHTPHVFSSSHLRWTDLGACVTQVHSILDPYVREVNREMEIHVEDTVPRQLYMHDQLVQQIWIHLVNHAIQQSPMNMQETIHLHVDFVPTSQNLNGDDSHNAGVLKTVICNEHPLVSKLEQYSMTKCSTSEPSSPVSPEDQEGILQRVKKDSEDEFKYITTQWKTKSRRNSDQLGGIGIVIAEKLVEKMHGTLCFQEASRTMCQPSEEHLYRILMDIPIEKVSNEAPVPDTIISTNNHSHAAESFSENPQLYHPQPHQPHVHFDTSSLGEQDQNVTTSHIQYEQSDKRLSSQQARYPANQHPTSSIPHHSSHHFHQKSASEAWGLKELAQHSLNRIQSQRLYVSRYRRASTGDIVESPTHPVQPSSSPLLSHSPTTISTTTSIGNRKSSFKTIFSSSPSTPQVPRSPSIHHPPILSQDQHPLISPNQQDIRKQSPIPPLQDPSSSLVSTPVQIATLTTDCTPSLLSDPKQSTLEHTSLSSSKSTTTTSSISHASNSSVDILVAEDNVLIRKLLYKLLHDSGYRVTLVSNGRELVDSYKQRFYPVLLTDLDMPFMSGVEAAKQLRGMYQDRQRLKIILMTAHAFLCNELRDSDRQSVDAILMKPIDAKTLRMNIERQVNSLAGNTPTTTSTTVLASTSTETYKS